MGRRRRNRLVAQVLAGAGGLVAVIVPVHPTGLTVVDRLFGVVAVAIMALAATRASRWTWLVLTGVAATFATTTPAAVVGVIGIVVAALASWRDRPMPAEGAVAGLLGALAALRMGDGGITGGSLLLGAVATGPVLWSGYGKARRRTRRIVRIAGLAAGGLVVLAVLGYGVAVLSARGSANQGERRLEQALDLARAGDLDAAADRFDAAADAFDAAARRLRVPWALPARIIPGLGPNARAASGAIDLAGDLTDDVVDVLDTVGTDDLSVVDGRLDPAVFGRLTGPVGGLLTSVGRAETRADDLDSPWLLPPLGDRLADVTDELRRARETADLAVEAVGALPVLLGAGGEQRYLVLFVTPVEARATGFPGNYAELVVRDGRFELARFGRIVDLAFPDDVQLDLPQAFLDRYLRFGVGVQWRSVTTSPDFPSVAALAAQLYPQTGGEPVDGVLTVDPAAIAGLLQFTGPITVAGIDEPLSAENAEAFLLRDQYVELPDKPDRVDALESLGQATFQRLITGNLPPPQALGRALGPLAAAGHLRLAAFDPLAAAFLRRLGLDHPLPPPVIDGLAVTTTNAVGGKLDLFLHRTIDYDVTIDDSGAVDATVRITLRNEAPSSGLPDYVIGNALPRSLGEDLPPGTNRMLLSVFSPLLSDSMTVDGQPAEVANTVEQGYQVYETQLTLAPDGGTTVVELHLTGAAATVPAGVDYQLDLWNQVLANPDDLHVRVNGEPVFDGPLDRPEVVRVHAADT